ncbi:SDR family NAD(P)-dependent oxidoreductase [Parafrigoribacterium humi]|jgi:2-deoxy-D-gluconate 3-dehydrogenase|uniref:SDR family NAD(P)-dependent oxidoreductase n=1 Tax=Parafrigoribacterium humi TaxID=3144664 RepID=UPI0032EE901A
MFDLTGRVALITGGNGGIGLGMARGLAGAGATVAIVGRDAAKNARAVAELGAGCIAISADLTEPGRADAVVAEVVEKTGRLDILVNNAGTNIRATPDVITDEQWATVMDTNLTSAVRMSRAAYPHLVASTHGRVISTGSMMSQFAIEFSPAYGASKGGIVQYTRNLAVAWGKHGITANALLPGWVETDLTRPNMASLNEKVMPRTPLKRWGSPDDFAGIAVFLASDASSFLTGAAIPVDGGFSIQG